MSERVLCSMCRDVGVEAKYTKPPYGSLLCQCATRTCACYGIHIALGVK